MCTDHIFHVLQCARRYEGMWRIKGVFHVRLSLTPGGGQRVDSCGTCFAFENVAPVTHITEMGGSQDWFGSLDNKFLLPVMHNILLFAFILSAIHAIPRKTIYILI